MPRRPLLAAVATLSTLTLLTACNGSPEAGRPNTTAVSETPSATPTPTSSPTSTWTTDEQAAIDAAKKQYAVARAAVDSAMAAPPKADRTKLENAGNGGTWITTVLQDVINFKDYGWYVTGRTKVTVLQVTSVNLKLEQPEVRLTSCIDSSATVIRSETDGKAVEFGPGNGDRHKVSAQIVYAPALRGSAKRWWVVAEEELGTC